MPLIVKTDFGDLTSPAFARKYRGDIDALVARAMNKGKNKAARELLNLTGRFMNAPLGEPVKTNPNVSTNRNATRNRLEAVFALIARARLPLRRVNPPRTKTPGGLNLKTKGGSYTRPGSFWARGNVWKRVGKASYPIASQKTQISTPASGIEKCYAVFNAEFDRLIRDGFRRLQNKHWRK